MAARDRAAASADRRSCWCACIRATRSSATRAFEGRPGVIVEKPFKQTVRAGDGMAVDVTADAQRHLANTMRHSDVVVQVVVDHRH